LEASVRRVLDDTDSVEKIQNFIEAAEAQQILDQKLTEEIQLTEKSADSERKVNYLAIASYARFAKDDQVAKRVVEYLARRVKNETPPLKLQLVHLLSELSRFYRESIFDDELVHEFIASEREMLRHSDLYTKSPNDRDELLRDLLDATRLVGFAKTESVYFAVESAVGKRGYIAGIILSGFQTLRPDFAEDAHNESLSTHDRLLALYVVCAQNRRDECRSEVNQRLREAKDDEDRRIAFAIAREFRITIQPEVLVKIIPNIKSDDLLFSACEELNEAAGWQLAQVPLTQEDQQKLLTTALLVRSKPEVVAPIYRLLGEQNMPEMEECYVELFENTKGNFEGVGDLLETAGRYHYSKLVPIVTTALSKLLKEAKSPEDFFDSAVGVERRGFFFAAQLFLDAFDSDESRFALSEIKNKITSFVRKTQNAQLLILLSPVSREQIFLEEMRRMIDKKIPLKERLEYLKANLWVFRADFSDEDSWVLRYTYEKLSDEAKKENPLELESLQREMGFRQISIPVPAQAPKFETPSDSLF
jgi:hypothetical protein